MTSFISQNREVKFVDLVYLTQNREVKFVNLFYLTQNREVKFVDLFYLTQNRHQCCALVDKVIKIGIRNTQ